MNAKDLIDEQKREIDKLKREIESKKNSELKNRNRKFWMLKKASSFFLGPSLKQSIVNIISEFNNTKTISKDSIADLGSNLIKRLTRVGLILTIISIIPLLLLFLQNRLIEKQNIKIDEQTKLFNAQTKLFQTQNKRIEQQTHLIEADRRSSQIFVLGDILSDLNHELKDEFNIEKTLSDPLIGRLKSICNAMKPYRYLRGDSLIKSPISPERGQLLIALVESKMNKKQFDSSILMGFNFSYAELQNADLSYIGLDNIYLPNSDLESSLINYCTLKNARFENANLRGSDIFHSDLEKSIFKDSNLPFVNFSNSNLRYADFSNANMALTKLKGADLTGANLYNAQLKGADFEGVKSLDSVKVHRTDWLMYIRDTLKLYGAEEIIKKYRLKIYPHGGIDGGLILKKQSKGI